MAFSADSPGVAVVDVPVDDAAVRASGQEGVAGIRRAPDHLRDGLVVAFNDTNWFLGAPRVPVVDESRKGYGEQEVAAPEASELLVLDGVSDDKRRRGSLGLDVPNLAGLVARRGQDRLRVAAPRERVDPASVGVLAARLLDLGDELGLLPLVDEDLAVEATRRPEVAVGRVSHRLTVALVLLIFFNSKLKLKR